MKVFFLKPNVPWIFQCPGISSCHVRINIIFTHRTSKHNQNIVDATRNSSYSYGMSLLLRSRFLSKCLAHRRFLVQERAYRQWVDIRGLKSAMEQPPDYSKWSPEDLIARVTALEHQLKQQTEL